MSRALEAARAAQQRLRDAGQTPERLDPMERARRTPASLRLALNAKCFDCVGGTCADHGHVRAIRECPSGRCPLHGLRPYRAQGGLAAGVNADDTSREVDG